MTQSQYTAIVKCITFGAAAQAGELIAAFNGVIAENNKLTSKQKDVDPVEIVEEPKEDTKSSEEE